MHFFKPISLFNLILFKTNMVRLSKAIFLLFIATVLFTSVHLFTFSNRESVSIFKIKNLTNSENNYRNKISISDYSFSNQTLYSSKTKNQNVHIPLFDIEEEEESCFSKKNIKASNFAVYYCLNSFFELSAACCKLNTSNNWTTQLKLPFYISYRVYRI